MTQKFFAIWGLCWYNCFFLFAASTLDNWNHAIKWKRGNLSANTVPSKCVSCAQVAASTMRTLAASFFCPNLECCWLLLLSCSPSCLLGGCIHDCRLLLCIIGQLLVRKAVVVPGVVVVPIVPVICCIVSVVILLLDLVNWNPAVSNKIPCTIAFVAHWRFSF